MTVKQAQIKIKKWFLEKENMKSIKYRVQIDTLNEGAVDEEGYVTCSVMLGNETEKAIKVCFFGDIYSDGTQWKTWCPKSVLKVVNIINEFEAEIF